MCVREMKRLKNKDEEIARERKEEGREGEKECPEYTPTAYTCVYMHTYKQKKEIE